MYIGLLALTMVGVMFLALNTSPQIPPPQDPEESMSDTIILPSGRVAVRPGHGNVQLYDISEADGTIHQFYKGKEVGRLRRRVTR